MSGFFKKLFNRVAGKKEEVLPPAWEPEALPPPEPEIVDPMPTDPYLPLAERSEFAAQMRGGELVHPERPPPGATRPPTPEGEGVS